MRANTSVLRVAAHALVSLSDLLELNFAQVN